MVSPPTFQRSSMVDIDAVFTISKLERIAPSAGLSLRLVSPENVAGTARVIKTVRCYGRPSFNKPPSCSWTRVISARFHDEQPCCATVGGEPTDHICRKFPSSGSPLRRSGIYFGYSSSPSRATKAAARGSELAAVKSEVDGAPLAIVIKDLALSFKSDRGDVFAVKECSLNVPQGQFWMLLGPNGCGKSTLLKAVAGLLRPSRGQMYVIGPRSFVFQNPDHQVVMPTAEADVAFGLGRFNLPLEEVRKRVHESLDAVGMADYAQRSVQTLSGGQKQRLAIAGALTESSRLLLLDELTTHLDSGDQIGVLEAVLKVVRGPHAVTALWVTHRLEELEYADGAAYMENGRVALSGSVADIKKYIQMKQEVYLKG